MSSQIYTKASGTLTAQGSSDGFVELDTVEGLIVKAQCYLLDETSDPTSSQFCKITSIDGLVVGLVFLPEDIRDVKLNLGIVKFPNYGRNNCSAYDTGSTLFQPEQVIEYDE